MKLNSYISYQRMSCYNSTAPSSSPQDVMVESHNPGLLLVSWQPPLEKNRNGQIIGYVIQYTRNGSNNVANVIVNNRTNHTISRLVADVHYSVIVTAATVNGTGNFSDPHVLVISGEGIVN